MSAQTLSELRKCVSEYGVIGIDEGQFVSDLVSTEKQDRVMHHEAISPAMSNYPYTLVMCTS